MTANKPATHTPGPWQVGPVFNKEGRALFVTDASKPGKWHRRLDDKGGVFAEQDARLIAAAPDLLAALEQISLWANVDALEEQGLPNLARAIHESRAAIARAKGNA